jgi:alkylhydroperoxidase family enzyme
MTDDSTRPAAGHFLAVAEVSDAVRALFDEDLADVGFVTNASRLWAYQPEASNNLFSLMSQVTSARPFTTRERGILVTACASTLGDSYCSLAWGTKLAWEAGAELAAGVLRGEDSALSEPERAMAAWARLIARSPNSATVQDVQNLRDAGFCDADIFAMTVFVALRVALSTVNDALGAHPDAELGMAAPPAVLGSVTYGRPVGPALAGLAEDGATLA